MKINHDKSNMIESIFQPTDWMALISFNGHKKVLVIFDDITDIHSFSIHPQELKKILEVFLMIKVIKELLIL